MSATTDLPAIKRLAKTLVYCDFKKTAFYPIVVQHPYTTTGITAVYSSTGTEIINLLENNDGLKKWQSKLIQTIDAAESVMDIYALLTKPYVLSFLDLSKRHLSTTDLSLLLRDAWIQIEFVYNNPVFSKAQFAELFRKCDPSMLMTVEERAALQDLPDEVEIFRGIRKGSKKIRGMSWTIDPKTAEFFSRRFADGHSRGDIYKACVRKADILAYFLERGEQEIVVDTRCLRKVEKLDMKRIDAQLPKPALEEIVQTAADCTGSSHNNSNRTICEQQR